MTNSYTRRYERGGRFKRIDAGDLGLRSYKDQQDRQIAWTKEQQKQAFEYGSQWLKAYKGKADREQTHRDKLHDLETKAYDTRRRAIQKRGETEVAFWNGKINEYKKEEQFWGNFSSTYAKQWGDLAANSAKEVGRMQAQNYIQRLRDQKLTNVREQDVHQILAEKFTAQANKDGAELQKQGRDTEAADVLSIPLLARPFIATAFKDWVKSNESDIRQMLSLEATKDPGSLLAERWRTNPDEVINSYIVDRARAWGLSGTSWEVADAADIVSHKQQIADNQKLLAIQYEQRNRNFNIGVEQLKAAISSFREDPEKYPFSTVLVQLKNVNQLASVRIVKNSNGTYTLPSRHPNPRNDQLMPTINALIDNDAFPTVESAQEFYKAYFENEKKEGRSGDILESDLIEIENAVTKRHREIQSAVDVKVKQDDLIQAEEGRQLIESGKLDRNDYRHNGDRMEAWGHYNRCTGPECKKVWANWLVGGNKYPTDIKEEYFSQREALREAAYTGDMQEFNRLYTLASAEVREGFEQYSEDFQELSRSTVNGRIMTPRNILELAKDQISGVNQFTPGLSSGLKDAQLAQAEGAYISTLWGHYHSQPAKDKSGTTISAAERMRIALERTEADLYAKVDDKSGIVGRGLLRRIYPGEGPGKETRTVWLAFDNEKEALVDKDGIASLVRDRSKAGMYQTGPGSSGWENIVDTNTIITQDQLDHALQASASGQPINPTDTVKVLVEEWNNNAGYQDQITVVDVYQRILQKNNITGYTLNPTIIDQKRKYISANNPELALSYLNRLSNSSIEKLYNDLEPSVTAAAKDESDRKLNEKYRKMREEEEKKKERKSNIPKERTLPNLPRD